MHLWPHFLLAITAGSDKQMQQNDERSERVAAAVGVAATVVALGGVTTDDL